MLRIYAAQLRTMSSHHGAMSACGAAALSRANNQGSVKRTLPWEVYRSIRLRHCAVDSMGSMESMGLMGSMESINALRCDKGQRARRHG